MDRATNAAVAAQLKTAAEAAKYAMDLIRQYEETTGSPSYTHSAEIGQIGQIVGIAELAAKNLN